MLLRLHGHVLLQQRVKSSCRTTQKFSPVCTVTVSATCHTKRCTVLLYEGSNAGPFAVAG
eukprot:4142115-Amphidinium_carterae.2